MNMVEVAFVVDFTVRKLEDTRGNGGYFYQFSLTTRILIPQMINIAFYFPRGFEMCFHMKHFVIFMVMHWYSVAFWWDFRNYF